MVLCGIPCMSQGISVRNNLLWDASGTANIGLEIPISEHWTIGANAGFKSWPRFYNKMRVAAWSERGNRMWAFYEVSPKGSTLKFIDNETAQVKALSSMTRNQELNVVMNVYYEEILREFNFTVDNVYWTDGNAHKPSHQFN